MGGAAGGRALTLPRSFYDRSVLAVARDLLGCVVERVTPAGPVAVRLTEVEAYDGANDPASHAFRGRTERNATMFGPPGHLYVYFTYGMHFCMNLVCRPAGTAGAVLLRAGEVVAGIELARARRPRSRDRDLARGPARLAAALAVDRALDGTDVTDPAAALRVHAGPPVAVARLRTGPRVGVGAVGAAVPWRFWIDGESTVSLYRPGVPRRRRTPVPAAVPPAVVLPARATLAAVSSPEAAPTSASGPGLRSSGLTDRVAAALAVLTSGAAQVLPQGALGERLTTAYRTGRPLRVKLGIDPSGSNLTLGHAVVLRKLRQFQDLGHLAVLIVGDITGTVGDPSGRGAARAALTPEETAANSRTYFEQVMRLLDPERVEVRRNSEWLADMTLPDVLREARELTVARLLERDDFARRYAEGRPISLVEFLYPLLQGYDSVAVHADVELGGTDQTYNLLVGRDLQRAHNQPEQVVLTVPLLEGLDGVQKMSKSLDNFVAITEPPEEQFGKLMSLRDDRLVGRYARLCTDLPSSVTAELEAAGLAGGPRAADAKRAMARAIVALYHGPEAAVSAERHFDTLHKTHGVPEDVPTHKLPDGDSVHLPALLAEAGLVRSRSEGRRRVDEGAVRLDGTRLPAGHYDLPRPDLAGRVLAVGRRRMVRLC